MKMIIEGMPRPSAVDTMRDGGRYQSIAIDAEGLSVFTEHCVDLIGHEACGWQHPTWPEEAAGRLRAHLQTCELRTGGEEEPRWEGPTCSGCGGTGVARFTPAPPAEPYERRCPACNGHGREAS